MFKNLFDQGDALLDFADAKPYAGIDVTGRQHGNGKVKFIVWRIARRFTRVEIAAAGGLNPIERGHADVHEHDVGFVELDQPRKSPVNVHQEIADQYCAISGKIGNNPARDDSAHHQPMTEADFGRAQNQLTQDTAMRVHDRERRVVADGADVAEMIRQPFELSHQQRHAPGRRRGAIDARASGGSGRPRRDRACR